MNAAAYSAAIDHIAIEIIHQAVIDTKQGSKIDKKEAAEWLGSCGLAWADEFGCREEIENLLYNLNNKKGDHE